MYLCTCYLIFLTLQSDICQASNLDQIRELTRQILPETLSKIIASVEARSYKDAGASDGDKSRELRSRDGSKEKPPLDEEEQDRQYSEVEQSNEGYRQMEDRLGQNAYLAAPVYYSPLMSTRQRPRDEPGKNSRSKNHGLRGKSYKRNNLGREQISKLSADLFKLDEPLFEDEAPRIKRVQTRLRNYESNARSPQYNIDEIVEKVRDRLRDDFEKHGHGYLLGDVNKKSFREGFNAQKSDQKTPDKDEGVILNYDKHADKERNVFKESPWKESPGEQGKRKELKLPYSNEDNKREDVSEENVKNEMPGSRFQVMKQPQLGYDEDDVAKEIDLVRKTTKGSELIYKKDVDITEEIQKQDALMYKKPLGLGAKKGKDSYEDYQIPQKEANIYASDEETGIVNKELRNKKYGNNNNNDDKYSNKENNNENDSDEDQKSNRMNKNNNEKEEKYNNNNENNNEKEEKYNNNDENSDENHSNDYKKENAMNIYSNEEKYNNNVKSNNDSNKNNKISKRKVTSSKQMKRVTPRSTLDSAIDYTEMTMADTQYGVHAVTEVMKWEYDEGTLKEDKNNKKTHTVLPTKRRYKSVTPNYYVSQPTVVEKYDSQEPLPVGDQKPEAHGSVVGFADQPQISINNRKHKKRLSRGSKT